MSLLSTILPIIRTVFSRWTALQLAVSHSMGGPQTDAKYEAFIEAFGQYLSKNFRPTISISNMQQDIQEYLDEILDEEFNTVLEDDSSNELAQLFIRYIELIQQGKLAEVQQELDMQKATVSSINMSVRNTNDESSSGDDDDDDIIDDEMKEESTSTDQSKPQSMDVDEDGWTTVHRRSGRKN